MSRHTAPWGPPPSTLCSHQHSILTLPAPPGSPLRSPQADPSPARWSWRSWKAPTGSRPKGPSGSWNHYEGGPGQARTRGTPRPPRQLQPLTEGGRPIPATPSESHPPSGRPPNPTGLSSGPSELTFGFPGCASHGGAAGAMARAPTKRPFLPAASSTLGRETGSRRAPSLQPLWEAWGPSCRRFPG